MAPILSLALLVSVGGCIGAAPEDFPWATQSIDYRPSWDLTEKAPLREGRVPIDLPNVLRLAGANNLEIAYVREKVQEAYARAADH